MASVVELAPSILSANFAQLGAEAKAALDGGGTVLHLDVMDGHFVPNLTIGPPVVASLRKTLPGVTFDCHLMIENADDFIPAFAEAGANWISVHQEACIHLDRTLHLIESHGCKPGVVINPATPVHTLDDVLEIVHHVLIMSVNPGFGAQHFIPNSLKKVESLVRIRESRGLEFRVEIDGGVALDTVAGIVRAGAEILVAGNAVFAHGDIRENARALLSAARSAAAASALPRLRRTATAPGNSKSNLRQRRT
ncbi:MAG TPA: ribulose-phosphate 3-epimerase [Candidatus Solibacter sp.]|nr:ribulose-phosphate 3-epimerase [Candidatus Solibacter sp.]